MLKWMAIQALATMVIAYTLPFLFFAINVNNIPYHSCLLLLNYHDTASSTYIRPDGFFYEPGVFQIYLNLYLYLALFELKNGKQAFLATVAVLSTQSTTGIIIALILLGARYFKLLRNANLRLKLTVLVLGAIVAAPLVLFAYNNAVNRFTGRAAGSSWAREYDLYTGLNVIAHHPLVGIGFDTEQYHIAGAGAWASLILC